MEKTFLNEDAAIPLLTFKVFMVVAAGALAFSIFYSSIAGAVPDIDGPACGGDGICNIGMCNSDPDCPVIPATHSLNVRRYTTSILTNNDADSVLNDASNVLQTKDGSRDTSCDVLLYRQGNVTSFSNGNGIINSQQDFNTIAGLTGEAMVVNQINWCGGIVLNAIGCGQNPGTSFVVVRTTANLEGILWAHEFGHTQGLDHRNGASAVMNPSLTTTRTNVNSTECDTFRN